MSRLIPNTGPPGNDYCTDPVELTVPVVIVNNGNDCVWFHQVLDPASADRLAFAMTHTMAVEAHRIDVRLILPAASQVHAATADLASVTSQPVRARLRTGLPMG